MKSNRTLVALFGILAAGCEPAPTPSDAAVMPSSIRSEPAAAAYGVADFHFTADSRVVRDSTYPPGVYDVPLDVDRALAFDDDSARTTLCTRTSTEAFELNGNVKYHRFQCDPSWNSRGVVFVADTSINIERGEMLEWTKLDGDPPLARPRSAESAGLHSYAQVAKPTMLAGLVLMNAAWFSGEYPPRKEFDDLRGDSIAFGHYTIRDRVLFIGESAAKASTPLLRANDSVKVAEPLEWAFLPKDASEKEFATFSTIYEIPTGYLLRVSHLHDHEGFGVDEFTSLYSYESGQWRLFATAERFRAY